MPVAGFGLCADPADGKGVSGGERHMPSETFIGFFSRTALIVGHSILFAQKFLWETEYRIILKLFSGDENISRLDQARPGYWDASQRLCAAFMVKDTTHVRPKKISASRDYADRYATAISGQALLLVNSCEESCAGRLK